MVIYIAFFFFSSIFLFWMMSDCQCADASFQGMCEAVTPLYLQDNPDVTQYEIGISALWWLSNESHLTGCLSHREMTLRKSWRMPISFSISNPCFSYSKFAICSPKVILKCSIYFEKELSSPLNRLHWCLCRIKILCFTGFL